MSTRLSSGPPNQNRNLHRVVPAGLVPSERRMYRPPDGWAVTSAPATTRALVWVDLMLLRVSGAIVRRLSRRQFLIRTAEVAAVVGLSLTRFLWATDSSRADSTCDQEDPLHKLPGGCGPSPECPDQHCTSNAQCQTSDPGVSRRVDPSTHAWAGLACGADSDPNCWTENCCTEYGHIDICCDCCTGPSQAPYCTGCTGRFRCLCRKSLQSC